MGGSPPVWRWLNPDGCRFEEETWPMKITCLDIYSDDHNPGIPKWRHSLAFAFLQAYARQAEQFGIEFGDGVVPN